LFHPTAAFRVRLVQGFLSRRSHPSSSEGASPLAVGPGALIRPEPNVREPDPRLRGFYPRRAAFLRPIWLTGSTVAPLFEFLLLQVPSPRLGPGLPRTLRS
jgi:hypothetical protein